MRRLSYGPRKTLHNRFVRWAAKGVWQRVFRALAASGGPASRAPARQQPRQGPSQRRGWKRGERAQAIGRSRGGRTTKIHAAANQAGKPIAVHLSGGNAADLRGGEALIEAVFEGTLVIADRAFAADRPPQRALEARAAVPPIPPRQTGVRRAASAPRSPEAATPSSVWPAG